MHLMFMYPTPATLPRVLQKLRIRGNIVPHREKERKRPTNPLGRNNAFALPPQYSNQGPLTRGPFTCQPSQCSCHVVPPERPRGLVWPCHAFAPPKRRVGSHSSATWLCVPSRIRAGPEHHVSSVRHVSSAGAAEINPLLRF